MPIEAHHERHQPPEIRRLAGRYARELEPFTEAAAAVARITEIYDRSVEAIRDGFSAAARSGEARRVDAHYPYVVVPIGRSELHVDARLSYGVLLEPGTYGTTLTRPDLFARYYEEQIGYILKHHEVPVHVGVSTRPIPLPFVIEESVTTSPRRTCAPCRRISRCPTSPPPTIRSPTARFVGAPGEPRPLALFTAERVDYSLARLHHYTGTSPEHFQNFVLLTNYQRYVDEFISFGRALVGKDGYDGFVAPGNIVLPSTPRASGGPEPDSPRYLPQMPAYHLKRPDGDGITLVNIGVGPTNAKTITDHIAVLRPDCWLMLGHCAGLRRSQLLGDYVLAHGYVRDDHVLDQDMPTWVPVPPIAEVQVALQEATEMVTGLQGQDLKTRAPHRHRRHHRQPQLGASLRRAVQPPEPLARHRHRHGIGDGRGERAALPRALRHVPLRLRQAAARRAEAFRHGERVLPRARQPAPEGRAGDDAASARAGRRPPAFAKAARLRRAGVPLKSSLPPCGRGHFLP